MDWIIKWWLHRLELQQLLIRLTNMLLLPKLTCDSDRQLSHGTGPSRTCIIVGVKNGVDNKNTGNPQNHVQHHEDLMADPGLSSRHMTPTRGLHSYSVPDCKSKGPVSPIASLSDNQDATSARHVGRAQPPVDCHSVPFAPFFPRPNSTEGFCLDCAVSETNSVTRRW